MQETLHGVLLGTLKYTEDTLIAHLYTLEKGWMSLTARVGGSRTRSQLRRLLAQAPALLEVEADIKPRGYASLRQARQTWLYQSLPYDPCKRAVAVCVAEFAGSLLRTEGQNPPLYHYLCEAFQWLDTLSRPQAVANFHIMVLLGLTARLGIAPSMEGYRPGMAFDLQEARFIEPSLQPSPTRLDPPQAAVLYLMCTRMGPRTLHLFAMNREQRAACMRLLSRYYAIHIPGFQPDRLKAQAVLKELF